MKNFFFVTLCVIASGSVLLVQACSKKTNQVGEVMSIDESSTEITEKETLTGIIKNIDNNSQKGCFFVDPEMIEAGVANALGDKANFSNCNDPKFGKGVEINFTTIDPNSDYTSLPSENVLLIFQGYWKHETNTANEQINTFYVTEYEPFF